MTDITKSQITKALKNKEISIADLQDIIEKSSKKTIEQVVIKTEKDEFEFNTETILSFVGGGILLLGILILISSNWGSFGNTGQIAITLGSGVFVALSSIFLQPILKKTYFLNITQIIASCLLLVGVNVLVQNIDSNIDEALIAAACFGYLSIVYAVMDTLFKKGIFTFQWLGFASVSYGLVVGHYIMSNWDRLVQYRVDTLAWIFVSLAYLVVAWRIWNTNKTFFKALILNLGAIGLMVSLFSYVQDYNNSYFTNVMDKNLYRLVAEHLYGLLFIAFYYLSQRIKSKVLLLSTSIGLFSWLMYMINVVYNLSNNLGISLIIGGIVLIGIGYQTFAIGNKFKSNNLT